MDKVLWTWPNISTNPFLRTSLQTSAFTLFNWEYGWHEQLQQFSQGWYCRRLLLTLSFCCFHRCSISWRSGLIAGHCIILHHRPMSSPQCFTVGCGGYYLWKSHCFLLWTQSCSDSLKSSVRRTFPQKHCHFSTRVWTNSSHFFMLLFVKRGLPGSPFMEPTSLQKATYGVTGHSCTLILEVSLYPFSLFCSTLFELSFCSICQFPLSREVCYSPMNLKLLINSSCSELVLLFSFSSPQITLFFLFSIFSVHTLISNSTMRTFI